MDVACAQNAAAHTTKSWKLVRKAIALQLILQLDSLPRSHAALLCQRENLKFLFLFLKNVSSIFALAD
jgi:hypothetical protein